MLKLAPPREESFTSRLRSPAVAARIGLWLGICFGIAFLTGLYSHFSQDAPGWLTLPTRPVNLYRFTQGLHVVAGSAAVPLLLVKLWSVYPRLFAKLPSKRKELLLHSIERASIGVLVAAGIFELMTGLQNSAQWYPGGSTSVARTTRSAGSPPGRSSSTSPSSCR